MLVAAASGGAPGERIGELGRPPPTELATSAPATEPESGVGEDDMDWRAESFTIGSAGRGGEGGQGLLRKHHNQGQKITR